MKGRVTFLGSLIMLLVLIQLAGWAQEKYIPKDGEELYGTWINDKTLNSFHVQKVINFAGGWKGFSEISETAPHDEGTVRIDKKWTDEDGNVWYETFNIITSGVWKGIKNEVLHKINKSGTVMESVWTGVGEFDPKLYPTEIELKDDTYQIFYRADATSSSFSGQEKDWTLAGSWINKAYEASPNFSARVVYGDDGVESDYQRLTDSSAVRATYSIEDSWTESGIHWFKVKDVWGAYTFYYLIKITEDGNTYEAMSSMGGYPSKFDVTSHAYAHIQRKREKQSSQD